MNINQLESFKLSDAVSFHDKLNPKLFANNKPRIEVKKQLLLIAKDFISELGIKDLDVKDITISGSNAAYTYTPHSDLDLHILVDFSKLSNDEVYRELFNAKKTIYNDSHDIKVKGVPVELYVQNSNEPVVSLGEYSLLQNKWLRIPVKRRASLDQTITKQKYNKLYDLVQVALKSKKIKKIEELLKTMRRYRQAGLDTGGEFSAENLAFKALRSQGWITKLYKLRDELHSKSLSIESMYENVDYEDGDCPIFAIALHRLGGYPLMALVEYGDEVGATVLIHAYVKHDNKWRLDINGEGSVEWYLEKYPNNGDAQEVEISEKDLLELGYGKNKCPSLQSATKEAKRVLDDLADDLADDLKEGASGYIPSNAEKNDPRYKTALTVDIKPDTMKQNAKKLGWNISRAGIPPLLRK
jgi:hypothetical protein